VSITRSRNGGRIRFPGEVEFDRWAPTSSCAAKPEPAMKVPLQGRKVSVCLAKTGRRILGAPPKPLPWRAHCPQGFSLLIRHAQILPGPRFSCSSKTPFGSVFARPPPDRDFPRCGSSRPSAARATLRCANHAMQSWPSLSSSPT
jgi:hypothetical protein